MISFSTAQTMNATLHAKWSFALVAFLEFLEMHEGVVPGIEEEILPPAFPVISPVPGRPARQLLGDCFQELERKKSGSACPANSPTTSWTSFRRTTSHLGPRQPTLEFVGFRVGLPVGDGFGVQPIHHLILDGISEEVIAARVVVADKVLFHIGLESQAVLLVVPEMDLVHVEVVELLFPEIVNDILVVARATFLHAVHGAIGIKEYDQQFPSILRGKFASLCQ